MRKFRSVAVVLAVLLLAACGGSEGGSTTVSAVAPTTINQDDGDNGTVGAFSDMPAECREAFASFLQELEPLVQDLNFDEMTQTDFDEMGAQAEEISGRYEDQWADCPDLDMSVEDNMTAIREFAEQEAPGTVAYFLWLEELVDSVGVGGDSGGDSGGGTEVSGDCETDIAAIQAYVDQGGTMNDLTMGELTAVGQLVTAITSECTVERVAEFYDRDDVAAWMGG